MPLRHSIQNGTKLLAICNEITTALNHTLARRNLFLQKGNILSKNTTELHPVNGVMGTAMAVRAKSRNVGRQVGAIICKPGHVVHF